MCVSVFFHLQKVKRSSLSIDTLTKRKAGLDTHTQMHASAHCFKMDNRLLWPQYYKQEWLSVKTNREERKGATTHIWFEKEEARMSFLGNQVQIKKREKRKHVCGYWRGLCVHVYLCVFIMCLHALCICACAQLQGCVCLCVCVGLSVCGFIICSDCGRVCTL